MCGGWRVVRWGPPCLVVTQRAADLASGTGAARELMARPRRGRHHAGRRSTPVACIRPASGSRELPTALGDIEPGAPPLLPRAVARLWPRTLHGGRAVTREVRDDEPRGLLRCGHLQVPRPAARGPPLADGSGQGQLRPGVCPSTPPDQRREWFLSAGRTARRVSYPAAPQWGAGRLRTHQGHQPHVRKGHAFMSRIRLAHAAAPTASAGRRPRTPCDPARLPV